MVRSFIIPNNSGNNFINFNNNNNNNISSSNQINTKSIHNLSINAGNMGLWKIKTNYRLNLID